LLAATTTFSTAIAFADNVTNALQEDVALFEKEGKAALTALCPPLEGIDPDDAFSAVPYEKGFALLYELQTRVGVLPFEAFVKVHTRALLLNSLLLHTLLCCMHCETRCSG
jgi:leukotriene-A4 hydrolase